MWRGRVIVCGRKLKKHSLVDRFNEMFKPFGLGKLVFHDYYVGGLRTGRIYVDVSVQTVCVICCLIKFKKYNDSITSIWNCAIDFFSQCNFLLIHLLNHKLIILLKLVLSLNFSHHILDWWMLPVPFIISSRHNNHLGTTDTTILPISYLIVSPANCDRFAHSTSMKINNSLCCQTFTRVAIVV